MKFIGDKQERGLLYDWKKIRKAMKALGIPSIYYNPVTAPLDLCAWFVELSERATGKTTGWLLLGMVMSWLYGTVTLYVRNVKDMIAPKHSSSLFNVIIENHYIEKITDGMYNNVSYKAKKWYFAYIDPDTGETVRKSENYFCRMIAVDESALLKSSLNEPYGDLILFDEFITTRYTSQNEFVNFVDIISTAFRLRECGKIVLLANTIDKYHQYFHDLEIFERISELQISESCTHTTDKGTKIYIELIGSPKQYRTKKKKWVELFAGFKKPELSAITGEALWAVKNYQHIPDEDTFDSEEPMTNILYNKIYLFHNNKYVRFDIVHHKELGTCVYVHWATKTYPDSVIITRDNYTDPRYIYGFPTNITVTKFLRTYYALNKIYYASNDVGSFVDGYLKLCGFTVK